MSQGGVCSLSCSTLNSACNFNNKTVLFLGFKSPSALSTVFIFNYGSESTTVCKMILGSHGIR